MRRGRVHIAQAARAVALVAAMWIEGRAARRCYCQLAAEAHAPRAGACSLHLSDCPGGARPRQNSISWPCPRSCPSRLPPDAALSPAMALLLCSGAMPRRSWRWRTAAAAPSTSTTCAGGLDAAVQLSAHASRRLSQRTCQLAPRVLRCPWRKRKTVTWLGACTRKQRGAAGGRKDGCPPESPSPHLRCGIPPHHRRVPALLPLMLDAASPLMRDILSYLATTRSLQRRQRAA